MDADHVLRNAARSDDADVSDLYTDSASGSNDDESSHERPGSSRFSRAPRSRSRRRRSSFSPSSIPIESSELEIDSDLRRQLPTYRS